MLIEATKGTPCALIPTMGYILGFLFGKMLYMVCVSLVVGGHGLYNLMTMLSLGLLVNVKSDDSGSLKFG